MRVVFAAVFMLVFINDALAMRCSNKLVRVGDYVSRMIRLCGQPDEVNRDVSIRGDRVVYIYHKNGRDNVIITRDNVIKEMR